MSDDNGLSENGGLAPSVWALANAEIEINRLRILLAQANDREDIVAFIDRLLERLEWQRKTFGAPKGDGSDFQVGYSDACETVMEVLEAARKGERWWQKG